MLRSKKRTAGATKKAPVLPSAGAKHIVSREWRLDSPLYNAPGGLPLSKNTTLREIVESMDSYALENDFERSVFPYETWALLFGDLAHGLGSAKSAENYAGGFLTAIRQIRELIRENIDAAHVATITLDLGKLIGEATAKGVFGRKVGAIGRNQKIIRKLLRKDREAKTERLWHAFKKLPHDPLTRESFSGEVTKARKALGIKKISK